MARPKIYVEPLQPIRLTFDANHIERLRELAIEQQRSLSWLVRQMVASGLEIMEAERQPGS